MLQMSHIQKVYRTELIETHACGRREYLHLYAVYAQQSTLKQ